MTAMNGVPWILCWIKPNVVARSMAGMMGTLRFGSNFAEMAGGNFASKCGLDWRGGLAAIQSVVLVQSQILTRSRLILADGSTPTDRGGFDWGKRKVLQMGELPRL